MSSLSQSSILSIAASPGESAQITLAPVDFANLKFGKHTTTVKASASGNEDTETFTIEKTFCKNGEVGNLSVTSVNINSDGSEDETWQPLDEVEVEVDVENTDNDNDVDDVIVQLALYDSAGSNMGDDLDFSNSGKDEIKLGNLNDGEDDTATFTFKVPADLDEGSYRLAVKAYSDGDEEIHCADRSDDLDNNFYNVIKVEKESDDEKTIIVDDIKLPTESLCGEVVTGSFTVSNIGTDNQDQVLVEMFNNQLSLKEDFEIRNNLNEGDQETIDFSFTLPSSGLESKFYPIQFVTNYDYDEDDNTYDTTSDKVFQTGLKVIGCGGASTSGGDIIITADLDSDAKAGETLVVSSPIKNTGSSVKTVTVDVTGYDSWASLESISKEVLSLEPGESETLTIEFNVDEDASGTQSFTIETDTAGKIETQEVEVNIATTSSGFKFDFGGNTLIWIIVLVNVILIVLIVVVAIRLSRR